MKKKSPSRKKNVASVECASYEDCLEQSEICCEQARAAAQLRRFTAARGLFATAVALCRRAIALSGGECIAAVERLSQVEAEMSAYSELAKSMERPLLARRQRFLIKT